MALHRDRPLKPRALRAGDRVAIVAPASPFLLEAFEQGVGECRALGFEPVYDDSVFARRGYVAGDPQVRATALRAAWQAPDIAGVFTARGGYGSVQLLPYLDIDEVRATPKVFVGYSDLTSLLVYFTGLCGVVSFHGPTIVGRLDKGDEGYDRDSLLRAVRDTSPMGEMGGSLLETVVPGQASGPLLGGTLSQLVASLGTPYAFDPPKGHVLFIDEVAERPFRIDRMITQLRLSGVLRRASAVVFGELPKCDEPGGGPTARATVSDLMADFSGPVLFGLASGHTTGPALTLPFGVTARVVADERPRLVIEEPAVQ